MPNFSILIMASSLTQNKSRHQTKRSCPDSGSSGEEIEQFPRWLVIQSRDDNRQSLDHVACFAIGKSLKAQIGTLDTVKRLQRGDCLSRQTLRSTQKCFRGWHYWVMCQWKSPHTQPWTSQKVLFDHVILLAVAKKR